MELSEKWDTIEKYLIETRYALRNKDGEPLEHNYYDVLNRISSHLDYLETTEDKPSKFFDIESIKKALYNKYIIPASPCLISFGNNSTRRKGYFSCFPLGKVPDEMEGINEWCYKMESIYKCGGGAGIDISGLRKKGSPVDGGQGVASGPCGFLPRFDAITSTTNQGGRRRGALLVQLDWNHPDIIDFINSKYVASKVAYFLSTLPPEIKPHQNPILSNMNISVNVDDDFFKNEKLLNLIINNMWETGDPGLLFINNMIKNSPFKEEARFSNPCVVGNTMLLTDKGYKEISTLENKTVNIWNGFEWSEVEVKCTGMNQEIYDIVFSNGTELSVTPYHKFILNSGERITASELKVNHHKIAKHNYPVISGNQEIDEKEIYSQGFYSGDGLKDSNLIYLYDEKIKLLNKLSYSKADDEPKQNNGSGRIKIQLDFNTKPKNYVPDINLTIKSRLDWLSGLMDSDGNITKDGCIQISSIDKSFLVKVKYLLQTLGASGNINLSHKSIKKLLPDGNGSRKYYNCQDCWRLSISATYVKDLYKLGLKTHRLNLGYEPQRAASRFIKIVSIEKRPLLEDKVYCFFEKKNNSGIFNGIMTGNCGEYLSPENLACNLITINVAKLANESIVNPDLDNYEFDNDKFLSEIQKYAELACRFGNFLITLDEGYPVEEIRIQTQKFRPVGVGMSGFHTALILSTKAEVPYGSEEACKIAKNVQANLTYGTLIASANLSFENEISYQGDIDYWKTHINNLEKHNLDVSLLRKCIKKYGGFYNCITTSQPPTGSVSQLLRNVDTGIEPFSHYETTRRVRDFEVGWKEFTLYPEALYPFLSEPTMKEKLESQTSMNISSKGQLQMLSAFQEYIHTGVSKTVNVPYETSKEQIKEIILDASKLKLKGFTIFRDKCREGVISQTVLQNKYEEKDELELSPMRQGTIFEVSGPVTAYVTVSRDKLSRPREVFVQVGPAGTMLNSMLSAFGRVISVALRENPELIDRFIYTLKCIESSELYNCIDDSMQLHLRSNSLPAILSQIFEYMKGEGMSQEVSLGDICPSCGKLSLFRKGGCKSCDFCGFTNC